MRQTENNMDKSINGGIENKKDKAKNWLLEKICTCIFTVYSSFPTKMIPLFATQQLTVFFI